MNADRRALQKRLQDILANTRRIIILNYKGGVGKSTITSNLAMYLASKGLKVWLFDLDFQSNTTVLFKRPLPQFSMVDVLYEKKKLADIYSIVRPNLWLFPSGLGMSNAEAYVRSQDGGVKHLNQYICELLLEGGLPDEQNEKYLPDYILFDTASDNGATTSAFRAAGEVIIPIFYEFFSMMGITTMKEIVSKKMEDLDHEVDVIGIIPNRVTETRKATKSYYTSLRNDEDFREIVWPVLHTDAKHEQAQKEGKSIFEYAPNSKGAHEFERVCKCVLGEYSVEDYLADLNKEEDE